MKRAKLILSDGTEWSGEGFGYEGTAIGEVAFTTLMGGTSEQIADPRCLGQLLAHTFTMMGNYGVPEGMGRAWPAGIIVREVCDNPSNYRCSGTLSDYLCEWRVPGLCGVDTRRLMRHTRATGPLLGAIVPADMANEEAVALIKGYTLLMPPAPEAVTFSAKPGYEFSALRVALIDFGAGAVTARFIREQFGCTVECLPYTASAESILATKPDGILLSDGWDHSATVQSVVDTVRALTQADKPILANGAGFLALTAALGGSVASMRHPHRGGNQPVREARTGRILITSQYHGLEIGALPEGAYATYINLHGDSVEGYALTGKNISGVQFDLTPQDGPHDPSTILKDFIYSAAEVAKICP